VKIITELESPFSQSTALHIQFHAFYSKHHHTKMKVFYAALLAPAAASLIRRDWTCPALIDGCTKTFLVTQGNCISVAAANNISTNAFFDLNPSINKPQCDNMYSGCSYCVEKGPTPPACPTDYDSRCDKFYEVKTGDTCWPIVQANRPLTINKFFSYNPSVHNPACDNLVPSCKYCINVPKAPAVPEPHQANIKTDCKEYYKAVSGDYCYKVAMDKGVTVEDFMKWNPDVGPTCLDMLAGYYYCSRV